MFSMQIINIMNTISQLELEAQLNLRISQINFFINEFQQNAISFQSKLLSQKRYDFSLFELSQTVDESKDYSSIALSTLQDKLKKSYKRFRDGFSPLLRSLFLLCEREKIATVSTVFSAKNLKQHHVNHRYASLAQLVFAIDDLSSFITNTLNKATYFISNLEHTSNCRLIYYAIKSNGERTAMQLCKQTSFDEGLVENILKNLLDAQLIECNCVQKLHVVLDNPAGITRLDQPFKYRINRAAPPEINKTLFYKL